MKSGGAARSGNLMFNFSNIVRSNGLMDLDFHGYPFTWHRGNSINGNIEERLDRFCVSQSWGIMFPTPKV